MPEQEKPSNRRLAERVDTQRNKIDVEIYKADDKMYHNTGLMANISVSGVAVRLRDDIELKTRLILKFTLPPHNEFIMLGTVLHKFSPSANEQGFVYGISFSRSETLQKDRLRRVFEAQTKPKVIS
ncbi:MAG: PilZ domain-containing protein [Elusimicrobiota bacterium]